MDKELHELEMICSDSYERMSDRDKKDYLKAIIKQYGFKRNGEKQ